MKIVHLLDPEGYFVRKRIFITMSATLSTSMSIIMPATWSTSMCNCASPPSVLQGFDLVWKAGRLWNQHNDKTVSKWVTKVGLELLGQLRIWHFVTIWFIPGILFLYLEPSLLFSPIFGPIWAVTVTAVASSGCHHSDGAPARRQWGVRSYFHFAFLHHLLHDNFGCHCFHFIAQNKLESNTLKLVEAFSDYFQRRLMS